MLIQRMATIEDQIKDVEDEIQRTPYNKATQHHIGKLKAKLARLKDDAQKRLSARGGGAPGYAVKKSGHATVAIVGFPSVGKSTLLNQITDANSPVAAYAFTTVDVIPGVLYHKGAQIQVLDMPGLIRGASKGRGRGREVISVARGSDLIMLMVDVFEANIEVLVDELSLSGIRLNQHPADVVISKKSRGGVDVNPTVKLTRMTKETIADMLREFGYINADIVVRDDISEDQLVDVLAGNRVYVPAFIVINKVDLVTDEYLKNVKARMKGWQVVAVSAEKGAGLEKLKDTIYDELNFIRIFLKPQGKDADMAEPLITMQGAKVETICEAIHRDFRRRFRYANVWGPSAKFPGQTVGLSHSLLDGDILTLVLRK
jgi:small GTP-binding protein